MNLPTGKIKHLLTRDLDFNKINIISNEFNSYNSLVWNYNY